MFIYYRLSATPGQIFANFYLNIYQVYYDGCIVVKNDSTVISDHNLSGCSKQIRAKFY